MIPDGWHPGRTVSQSRLPAVFHTRRLPSLFHLPRNWPCRTASPADPYTLPSQSRSGKNTYRPRAAAAAIQYPVMVIASAKIQSLIIFPDPAPISCPVLKSIGVPSTDTISPVGIDCRSARVYASASIHTFCSSTFPAPCPSRLK